MFELEEVVINGNKHMCWKNVSLSAVCRTDSQNPKTYREFLLPRMKKWSDRVMVDAPKPDPNPNKEREDITYGEVLRRAFILGGWLRERGCGLGSRVAVVGYNSINWVISFLAVQLIGGSPVVVNAATSVDSLVHCLSITRPKIVLMDAVSAGVLSAVADELAAAGVGEVSCGSLTQLTRSCSAGTPSGTSRAATSKLSTTPTCARTTRP